METYKKPVMEVEVFENNLLTTVTSVNTNLCSNEQIVCVTACVQACQAR